MVIAYIWRDKEGRTTQVISDFRRLNQAIKHNPSPIPTIHELLHTCDGITYATTIDQIMGYLDIAIHPSVIENLTIITLFGKYQYENCPWV